MGSQHSTSKHQALSDAHPSGIPGLSTANNEANIININRGYYLHRPQLDTSLRPRPLHHKPVEARSPTEVGEELVHCVFTWKQGGHSVYLTGSFCNWTVSASLKLVKAGHEFIVVKELPKGIHHYKFIVDDQWRYAPDQQTVSDDKGNMNNILDISNYRRESYEIPTDIEQAQMVSHDQEIPHPSAYTSDASPFPVLLGKYVCVASDPPAPRLGVPLHAVANHLYHDSHAQSIFGPHLSTVAATVRCHSQKDENLISRHATYVYMTINALNPPPHISRRQMDFGTVNVLESVLLSKQTETPVL